MSNEDTRNTNQNPPVTPATPEESLDFLLSNDDIMPSGMTELDIYKETIARSYVSSGWAKCPHCQSSDIVGGGTDFEDNKVYNSVSCSDCGAAWVDVYKLAQVANLTLPDED